LQAAPRLEHAAELPNDGVLVGAQVDHAVGEHDVGAGVGHRQRLGQALAELRVGRPNPGCVGPRLRKHGGGHIHSQGINGAAVNVDGGQVQV